MNVILAAQFGVRVKRARQRTTARITVADRYRDVISQQVEAAEELHPQVTDCPQRHWYARLVGSKRVARDAERDAVARSHVGRQQAAETQGAKPDCRR